MKKKIIYGSIILLTIIIGLIIANKVKENKYYEIVGYPNMKIAVSYNGEARSDFPAKDSNLFYNVIATCDNADAKWDYDNWELVVYNLVSKSRCKVSFTTSNKDTLYNYIVNTLYNNMDGSNNIYREDHTINGNSYSEYRYEGEDTLVYNYVWFNNELWRIIGAFPGGTPTTSSTSLGDGAPSTNNTVKIIRNDSIGSFAWDKSNTNDWTVASLNREILNNLYLNSGSGTCYFYSTTVGNSCSFEDNGLANVQDYIETATWNLGGYKCGSVSTSVSASDMYTYERGTTVYNSGRPVVTTAKVGLMYPSDYGYSVTDANCSHTSKKLRSYNTAACGGKAWLLKYGYEWTSTPCLGDPYSLFIVFHSALVSSSSANSGYGVRPVLYLKSNIYVTGGDGSINNPYQLSLS